MIYSLNTEEKGVAYSGVIKEDSHLLGINSYENAKASMRKIHKVSVRAASKENSLQNKYLENPDSKYIENADIEEYLDQEREIENDMMEKEAFNPKKSAIKSVIDTVAFPITFLDHLKNKFQPGSIKGSVFTLMCATLGAGVLSLPVSILKSGIYWGIIQFLFCAYLGYFSTMLLVQCADATKKYSYMAISQETYGTNFTYFVKFSFFISNWGFIVAYMVLVNKLIATVLDQIFSDRIPWELRDPNGMIWAPVVTVLYGFPVSLARTLSALRYSFLFSVGFVTYISITIIVFSFVPSQCDIGKNYTDDAKLFEGIGVLSTFPVAVFAYLCHPNVLDVFYELQRPSMRRMSKVLSRVMLIVTFLYLFVGVLGYLTFANNTDELTNDDKGGIILLANYHGSPAIILALALICGTIMVAFPLVIKPTKDSFLDIIKPGVTQDSTLSHILITSGVVLTSLGASLFIKNMNDVLTFSGATFNLFICFHFPIMFNWKLLDRKKSGWKRKLKFSFTVLVYVLATLLFVFGLIQFFMTKAGTPLGS